MDHLVTADGLIDGVPLELKRHDVSFAVEWSDDLAGVIDRHKAHGLVVLMLNFVNMHKVDVVLVVNLNNRIWRDVLLEEVQLLVKYWNWSNQVAEVIDSDLANGLVVEPL